MSQTETIDRDDYDPSWITGKALERHFPMQDALFEFSRLFRDEENDLALAIVGGAFLDTLLENILIEFLVDDEKEVGELLRHEGPLGTYSGKVRAAYCLGLLRKPVRDDLRLVGKIRNRFAHDLSASFTDQQIASWCEALRWHRQAYMEPPPGASARDLFHVGVNQLVGHLDGYVSIARGEKRFPPRGD
jgi:DNA-binding MltR family transcriptional regulator